MNGFIKGFMKGDEALRTSAKNPFDDPIIVASMVTTATDSTRRQCSHLPAQLCILLVLIHAASSCSSCSSWELTFVRDAHSAALHRWRVR